MIKLNRNIKNSKRDIYDTYRVTGIVFPRIRITDNDQYITDDLENNVEKSKYSEEFFPTVKLINKNKKYIEDYLYVYLNHKTQKLELSEGYSRIEPVGWVERVTLTDNYNDNSMRL